MALKVAIVGRPNVGKSTLFNRLAGKKLAIVHDRPGVTRDRREADARFGELELVLIDTAGFENERGESLEARMREQTEQAIAEADAVLFVIDARAGVTPLDETFAQLVRRADRPVALIANKCEGRAGVSGLGEAYALGLGEPIAFSAEHGEGMSELYDCLMAFAAKTGTGVEVEAADAQETDDEIDVDDKTIPIRIAVVGRPNAGKSTLINALIGADRLLTGPEPGVTRDAIAVRWRWNDRDVRMHDTAGLRKKARIDDEVEKLSTADTIRAIRFAEVVVLVLDAANALEKQDLQIADLVEREGRGLVIVVSKWDLVDEPQTALAHLRERVDRLLPQVAGVPLLTVSGLTGRGLDKIMPTVEKLRRNWSAKVKTPDLNAWLKEAIARHPPPAVSGRRIKPRYMAQTKSRPPTFVLMCSRAEALPDAYRRYLINGVREAFGLPAVPIRLHVRSSRNPYADDAKRA